MTPSSTSSLKKVTLPLFFKHWKIVIISAICVALLASVLIYQKSKSKAVILFGTLGGWSSKAVDINNAGQVIGDYRNENGDIRAFLWTKESGMQDLGTLGGRSSYVAGIDENGQVYGSADNPPNSPQSSSRFRWTKEKGMEERTDSSSEIDRRSRYSISQGTEDESVPTIYYNKKRFVLNNLGGKKGSAYPPNDKGQATGNSEIENGDEHSFFWSQEQGMLDIGTLGGRKTHANYINNHGQIVGYSLTKNGEKRAFIWSRDKGIRELETLAGKESEAVVINDSGEIVGYIKHSPPWWVGPWGWIAQQLKLSYKYKPSLKYKDLKEAVLWRVPPDPDLKQFPTTPEKQ
ncbi:MAG: hypothetical protein LBV12_03540 [Puniceicoccales bacterium]|jgi:probable HAF family extracellular repeat protein|nr:hypothetical protein [Puniceicoccales bacterium]